MSEYEGIEQEKMILRDRLAIDRTSLAAERTSLAYFRTGLTMGIAGVTISKFFPEVYYQISSWIFMVSGVTMIVYTMIRFRRKR